MKMVSAAVDVAEVLAAAFLSEEACLQSLTAFGLMVNLRLLFEPTLLSGSSALGAATEAELFKLIRRLRSAAFANVLRVPAASLVSPGFVVSAVTSSEALSLLRTSSGKSSRFPAGLFVSICVPVFLRGGISNLRK
jgi:hypothetical protein